MLHLAPIFFGGKLGILEGKLLPLKYTRQNPVNALDVGRWSQIAL